MANLEDEDLRLLQEFTDRANKMKRGRISETGKRVIRTVKQSIKNRPSLPVKFDNIEQEENGDFVMKKGATLGIDGLSDRKLSRGEYKIDYKLDLHGLTLDEAYNKIRWLFEKAYLEKYRCLLIVTGKGLHSKDKTIKSSLEDWFREPFFANRIIKYVDAHLSHGGGGAVYVLLRK